MMIGISQSRGEGRGGGEDIDTQPWRSSLCRGYVQIKQVTSTIAEAFCHLLKIAQHFTRHTF